MDNQELWSKCVSFHGHECGGLTIGYKAALYAIELLELTFSKDEEIVCISENDACGNDAIQVILGCSIGKGNLMFHINGKQAFSFYNRTNNKSIRLVLKPRDKTMTKEESFKYFQELALKDMFEVKETKIVLPIKAKLFESYQCSICKEETGSNWIRIKNGQPVCLDCYENYNRFDV